MTERETRGPETLLGWGPDKRILAFNLALIKRVVTKKLCDEQGALLTIISPAFQNVSLVELVLRAMAGEKLNEEPKDNASGQSGKDRAFTEEMLVFCGFASDDLDRFLEGFRLTGVPRVDLKAVLTQYNADWTPEKLFEELKKEHEAFEKQKK
ncbi:MAG: DUF3783 domain-containing protein [Lachnospiraceae bacterium]|nr:DUF3783 domain-containing protein [Lachnospiraceae bacterium]